MYFWPFCMLGRLAVVAGAAVVTALGVRALTQDKRSHDADGQTKPPPSPR